MSDLLVVAFPSEEKAELGRQKLLSMEKEGLITMEDAVVVVKKADGAIKLKQFSKAEAFWEIRAAASGYPVPTGAGALTDFGMSDKFVKNVADAILPGCAALLVLTSKIATDKVLQGLRSAGGNVLQTAFDKSAVETIRAALTHAGILAKKKD